MLLHPSLLLRDLPWVPVVTTQPCACALRDAYHDPSKPRIKHDARRPVRRLGMRQRATSADTFVLSHDNNGHAVVTKRSDVYKRTALQLRYLLTFSSYHTQVSRTSIFNISSESTVPTVKYQSFRSSQPQSCQITHILSNPTRLAQPSLKSEALGRRPHRRLRVRVRAPTAAVPARPVAAAQAVEEAATMQGVTKNVYNDTD